MIIKQYQKPFVPKYANYDYTKVYNGNGVVNPAVLTIEKK